MGGGFYSATSRAIRSDSLGYTTNTLAQNFKAQTVHKDMSPMGLKIRESRDSKDHPNSIPIIVALDVTGSMGNVPQHLVKEGLPKLVTTVIGGGIPDPQILFLAVGDHECDRQPLQVAQFESSDELLDHWLTSTFLEGGGGGNAGESYLLAWYAAAYHTSHDHWDKRGKKGYLFTIGDEPNLKSLPASALKHMFGGGQFSDHTAADLLTKARERYHVKHIHVGETPTGAIKGTADGWAQLIGKDNLLVVQSYTQIDAVISAFIVREEGSFKFTTKEEMKKMDAPFSPEPEVL